MNWLKLSMKEWQRRPVRTGIAMAGVAIAIAGLWSLVAFQHQYRKGMDLELDRLGAHILLAPKGCPYDAASMALHGASWPCFLKESYLSDVRGVTGVAEAAPVFMTAVHDEQGTQTVYVGVQTNVLRLKPAWKMEGTFPSKTGDLLIGSEVARQHKWDLGQEVPLVGVTGERGQVSGILNATQGPDDTFIFMQLAEAQRLFKHEKELTHILVRLGDPNDLDQAVTQLRGCDAGLLMNVVPLAHVFRSIQSMVNSTRLLLGCIALVGLLIAATGVANTILMAVSERRSEIGTLRAIGASRVDVFHLIWLETLQTCCVGSVVGVMLAALASGGVEGWVRSRLPFAPTDPLLQWEWWIAGICFGAALLLGSVAGFLPAWKAASIPPMLAMRNAERS